MALIKCKECGKEISDTAINCPHCGCPVEIKKNTEEIEQEIAEKFVYENIGLAKLNELTKQNNVLLGNVLQKIKELKENPDPNKYKKNDNNVNVVALIIGIILFIFGVIIMSDGTSSMLGTNKSNNKVRYDEKNDTYTYTIWEDKNFSKDNPNVIWIDE